MTTKYDSDIRFRNVSGDKILRGAPVMLVGAVGQHGLLTGALMDASDTANAEKYLGMATSDVIDGAEGHLRAFGDIRAANTSAWGDGDVLYCDPETPGALTATKPTAGLVFPVAVVSRAHPDQGVLQVKGAPAQSNVATAEVNPVTGGVGISAGSKFGVVPVSVPVGDGVESDHAAFSAAIAAAGVGGVIALMPGATYVTDRRIQLLVGQRLVGNGATIKRIAQIKSRTNTTVTSGVTSSIQLTAGDGAKFSVGQTIVLTNGGSFDGTARLITAINDDLVSVSDAFGVSVTGTTDVYLAFGTVICADDCAVEDVTFDGNRAAWEWSRWETVQDVVNHGSRVSISGCFFKESPGEGIIEGGTTILNQKTGCSYEGNRFVNIGGNAMHFSGSRGSRFANNSIRNANLNLNVGHVGGGVTLSDYCMYVDVSNNYIDGCYGGVGQIDCWGNSFARVVDNVIVNCLPEGIYAKSGNVNSAAIGLLIKGNTLINSGPISVGNTTGNASASTTGTLTSGSSRITGISNMTALRDGAFISGVGIPANTIVGWFDGKANEVIMTTIDGKEVQATTSGLTTISVSGRAPWGSVVEGNYLHNSGTGNNIGAIQIQRNSGLSAVDNKIHFNPDDTVSFGIYLGAENANYLISGNTIEYGSNGIRGQTAGGDAITIDSNLLINQSVDGINMRNIATYTGSLISNNVIRQSLTGTSAVGITPGAGQSIIGNTVHYTSTGWRRGIRINASAGNVVKNNVVRIPSSETSIEVNAGSTGYVVTDNAVSKAIVDTAAVGVRVANNDLIV